MPCSCNVRLIDPYRLELFEREFSDLKRGDKADIDSLDNRTYDREPWMYVECLDQFVTELIQAVVQERFDDHDHGVRRIPVPLPPSGIGSAIVIVSHKRMPVR
jgi:hypothetical protein